MKSMKEIVDSVKMEKENQEIARLENNARKTIKEIFKSKELLQDTIKDIDSEIEELNKQKQYNENELSNIEQTIEKLETVSVDKLEEVCNDNDVDYLIHNDIQDLQQPIFDNRTMQHPYQNRHNIHPQLDPHLNPHLNQLQNNYPYFNNCMSSYKSF